MTRDIVINGRFLSRRVTGVERHGREILRELGASGQVETTGLNGIAGHAWEQFLLPRKLDRESILWSPANTGPLMVRNQVLTIHDLSPLEHPEWFDRKFALWYRWLLPNLAKRVRVIFTPSEFVKRKIMERFGIENVTVTPNGVDVSVFHPKAEGRLDLPKRYVLFVGSLQARKNLAGLLQAWHAIKDQFCDVWLVVAGEPGRVFQAVQFFADERIRFLNYVPEDDLPGLYAHAECFVLPSFDEGFGLPVLEAMACGTPVIVSDGGALPETVGDAGLVFQLSEPGSLARTLKECLTDGSLRHLLREKGLRRVKEFSWCETAGLIWRTLNEL